jgi:hypothetical protein
MSQSENLIYVPVTSIMKMYNDGDTIFFIKNEGVAPITVTADSAELCDQGVDHNVDIIITNSEARVCGPYPQKRFNDGTGRIQFLFSDITSVTIAPAYLNK